MLSELQLLRTEDCRRYQRVIGLIRDVIMIWLAERGRNLIVYASTSILITELFVLAFLLRYSGRVLTVSIDPY